MNDKKPNSEEDPTVSGGLKKGYEDSKEMWSTPRGRLGILYVVGSLLWFFVLVPATAMKLEEAFPNIGVNIGLIAGLALCLLWVVLLVLSGQWLRTKRNIRLYGKPRPSLKEALPHMKEQIKQTWKEINRD